MPTAASAIPYSPASSKVMPIATTIVSSGITVESMPRPRPPIITVPAPVSACSANFLVGENSNAV